MFKKLRKSAEKLTNSAKEKAEDYIPEEAAASVSNIKGAIEERVSNISDEAGDYLDSNLEDIESYCSWCFEKHGCTLREKNNFSRNIYICDGCGKEVLKCRACDNKAKYGGEENTDNKAKDGGEENTDNKAKDGGEENTDKVDIWSGNFCSVHEGTIAKFETLTWQLSSIGEYRDIVEREEKNYKKIGTTAAFTIGGAAVIAPLALAAAPAIGGAIGTSLLGYSGAVATNTGLAMLGGGALAAGGAGMAGGVAVVTAAGSALGGRYGAVISNSYYGDIDGFEIIKIKQGKGPSIICIDGFLTEKSKPSKWIDALEKSHPDNEIYYVKWESKRLRDIANSVAFLGGKEIAKKGLLGLAKSASKKAATKLAPVGIAFQALGLATNPWSVAGVKAYQTGILLADIIARTDKEYILMGHSLGARVIYSCLATLKTKDNKFIKEAHLFGGAIDNNCPPDKDSSDAVNRSETHKSVSGDINNCPPDKDSSDAVNWSEIHKSVSGDINNYFSCNDAVLKYIYKMGEAVKFEFGNPIGRHEIGNTKINNIDVSCPVRSHTKYMENIPRIIRVSKDN